MNKLTHHLRRFCGLTLLAAALGQPAWAGGIHDIPLTSIPFARSPIAVDGSLADWPDTHPVPITPLNSDLIQSDSPALKTLRSHPDSAALQTAYDNKTLYLGIVWNGLASGTSRSEVVFHISTDRIAHVRVETAPGARTGIVEERIGDDPDWRSIAGSGAKSVLVAHAGGTATQEIGIPWSALTASKAAPGSLTIAADLQWPNLTPALLSELPAQLRHDNTHTPECFLTSPAQLFTQSGYLGNPNDWGALHFVGQPHENTTEAAPLATGATETFVPAVSSPVSVDGHLSEWNPAQFQTVAAKPGFLGDRYSAKIAASYDGSYLYIAAHVKSVDGPLNTEPEPTQAGFSGGDCLQVRLNDGHQTVNLCGWYDSADKQPALTADGNDLKNPYLLKQGAKEAFQRDADGQGYTQEIAVPWSVLPSGAAPKDGDSWKGSFQVWWSGLNPQFTVVATAALASSGGIAYSYRLPVEADVTLGVFDAQGHLVRSLVKAEHRRAGLNTEYWDGKDQYGSFVAPGRYQVRGLNHSPIYAQAVVSVGNPGSPPWPTADGTGDWMSDEMTPQGAVSDGTNVYLAAPGSEKGTAIIAVGPDGKRLWGYGESFSFPRSVSLAVHGQYLFALFCGPEYVHATDGSNQNIRVEQAFMICLDKTTGAPALFSTQKPDYTITTWPYVDRTVGLWDLRTNKTFSPETYGGQPRYATNDVGEPADAVGIAAAGDRLYVSMLSQNQILILDAATGHQLDTLSITHPVGLNALSDGTLLGVSDGKVVHIDPATKTVNIVIDHDLVAPEDVTTDGAGRIYVSDWGTSFQVKVFSASGTFIHAVGTPGGRSWIGKWDAGGMLLPHGIAVTGDGKLWVAEDDTSPSRISVWNASTGALIRDYLGPTAYGGGGAFWADPANPSNIIAENTLYHVSYAKKTWTPVSTALRRMSLTEPFTPGSMTGISSQRVLTHAGKQYYFCSVGGYSLVVFRRDGNVLKAVAAMGDLFWPRSHDGTDLSIFDSNIGDHYIANYFPPFFKGHTGENFVWTDRNGDGEVQPDEMEWVPVAQAGPGNIYVPGAVPGLTAYWGYGVGPDGSVYGYGNVGDKTIVGRVSIQSWLPNGVPVYSMANAKAVVVRPQSDGGVQGVYVDNHNQVYLPHGYGYEGTAKDGIDVYDQDNNFLWGIAETKAQQPDDILANNVIGEFQEPGGLDILGSWLWHGNFKPYLFTNDGLYVTSLLEDTQLGPTATWDESYKNYFQAPDGSAYIVNGGKDTYNIDRIVGLDHIHRFTGAIRVTQAQISLAEANEARLAAAPAALPPPILHVAWLTAPPALDGSLTGWDMQSSVALTGSRGRTARIALGRDQTNLYLAYDVHGAKLVNKGTDWRTLFITGDCDDLMLHLGQFKPHFAPAEGDERLLLSVYQGKPVAVLYRPVVPGTATPAHLMSATIDQIVRLPNARIAYKRTASGYTLEASVPLADIGIAAAETETLRGDVGVIYADETGSDRSLRLYYYNHNTAMTADLTTEASLQPGEWGDIEMPLGPNLLKNGDFEQPLASSLDQGWTVVQTRSGATASITGDAAFSGSHSLVLEQGVPNTVDPAALALPASQKDAFFKALNNGQGGGRVAVRQRVQVTPGRKYSLRLHYHLAGFPNASDLPSPDRGYSSYETYLGWEGPVPGTLLINRLGSNPGWETLFDDRFNNYDVKSPYTAPPGVSSVFIDISFENNASTATPKVYIDDAEMVEVP